ncbi:hypothetical protein [Pseudomonas fluorescens]|uniref:hypothetical protein n=1 Tax=Pseudomonas fluorescens TaxID=294 RepID=UPI00277E5FAE|nr:hypothetical protein [Pseudomonas fluorescens]MDP9784030.1 hypothetical protein [Pseudomonas fluorescens]
MAAPRRTLAQYLEWAAIKPRTTDWSALVAYDRGKCNQLLLQEYIEKHDKHSVMPPISEPYGSTDKTWTWLIDYVTDAPRLSFENNPDLDSAEANMSMAILGGKNITMDDVLGFAQINKISSYDPLDHPTLVGNRVELKDIQGTVQKDGQVVLDLGDPRSQRYIWEVKGDRVEHERRMAGAFFKRKFREADPVKRTFFLGMLATTTQAFMKPQTFKLRTIMEEGAATRGAANFGSGAVEVRIAMDDEIRGGTPGDDWLYPLPSDRPDLDAMMIFGSHFFMHGIIGKGTARAFNSPTAQFVGEKDSKGFTYRIKVKEGTSGFLEIPQFQAQVASSYLTFFGYRIPIYIDRDNLLTMTLYYTGSGEPYFEVGMGGEDKLLPMKMYMDGEKTFSMGLGFSATYGFSIDPTSRRLQVRMKDHHVYLRLDDSELESFPSHVQDYMKSEPFKWNIAQKSAEVAMTVFNGLEDIDVFVLHTLFFNSEDAVQLKSLHLTGEMALFGSISPRLTTFSIEPVEHMLTYDGTHTFKAEPSVPGVTWSVEDLEGNTVGVGRIHPTSGEYTAPSLADIHGTYKRVKIVATARIGNNPPHISKALVTVVARAITLNPLIEVCNGSKAGEPEESRMLSAHSTSGALRWRVEGDGRINETANENGENTYYAPPKLLAPAPAFTIDKVIVKNTATNVEQTTLIVVRHYISMVIDTSFDGVSANQVRLLPLISGATPTEPVIWQCIPEDAGDIDSDSGIFTVRQTTNSQFALITSMVDLGWVQFSGFTILSFPLAPLPTKPPPEIPQTTALDDLNGLLEDVYEKVEQFSQDSDVREKAKEYLDHIASLAEDAQNGH